MRGVKMDKEMLYDFKESVTTWLGDINTYFDAISEIFTVSKPLFSFLENTFNKKKINDYVIDIEKNNINQIEKDIIKQLKNELESQFEKIKKGNNDEILDWKFKKGIVDNIIEKNNYDEKMRDGIEKYIDGFISLFYEYYKKKDTNGILVDIIKLMKNSQIDASHRDEEIKKLIVSIKSENTSENVEHLVDLPFEINNISKEISITGGEIVFNIQFALNKENFKVVPEAFFLTVESTSGRWVFHNRYYFWENRNTSKQNVKITFDAERIRKIESYGVVAFYKIYNNNKYYIKLFGTNDSNIYYEQLTEEAYLEQKNRFTSLYNKAIEIKSEYEHWREYHWKVLYCDFGR